MLDHVGVPVSDYKRAKAFYVQVLAPLGYGLVMEVESVHSGGRPHCGFGAGGKPSFWISQGEAVRGHMHMAFQAASRDAVDAFYEAALKAGGSDNGPPGLRPHYHENYYGAFVLDPDGYNIEAVCHLPR